jgi:hypothetical protein
MLEIYWYVHEIVQMITFDFPEEFSSEYRKTILYLIIFMKGIVNIKFPWDGSVLGNPK